MKASQKKRGGASADTVAAGKITKKQAGAEPKSTVKKSGKKPASKVAEDDIIDGIGNANGAEIVSDGDELQNGSSAEEETEVVAVPSKVGRKKKVPAAAEEEIQNDDDDDVPVKAKKGMKVTKAAEKPKQAAEKKPAAKAKKVAEKKEDADVPSQPVKGKGKKKAEEETEENGGELAVEAPTQSSAGLKSHRMPKKKDTEPEEEQEHGGSQEKESKAEPQKGRKRGQDTAAAAIGSVPSSQDSDMGKSKRGKKQAVPSNEDEADDITDEGLPAQVSKAAKGKKKAAKK